MKQFEELKAIFEPKITNDLRDSTIAFIGKTALWRAEWIIEKGKYKGQWAMRLMSSEYYNLVEFAWVPEEDLKFLCKGGKMIEMIEVGRYGFVLKKDGTIKKCKCGHQLDLYFSDKETEYNYECENCGFVSGISRNYESEYAKELGLYEKRQEDL